MSLFCHRSLQTVTANTSLLFPSMAVEFPLVLYDCEFENIQWLYDQEVQEFNVTHLQQLWASHAIKTQVLRSMLQGLDAAPVAAGKGKGWGCGNIWVRAIAGTVLVDKWFRAVPRRTLECWWMRSSP